MGDQSDPQSWEQLVPLPALWHFNGAGIGFPQRSCKAEATYVAKVLPSGGAREGGCEQPGADTIRRRIKKILPKGLRSHASSCGKKKTVILKTNHGALAGRVEGIEQGQAE